MNKEYNMNVLVYTTDNEIHHIPFTSFNINDVRKDVNSFVDILMTKGFKKPLDINLEYSDLTLYPTHSILKVLIKYDFK